MKRPVFLMIWLILMAIGYLYSLYNYILGTASLTQVFPSLPGYFFPIMALASVTGLVATYLLWTWKKLGFYIVVGITVLSVVVNFAVMGVLGAMSIVFGLVGIGILYLAMKPVWSNFK